MKMSLAKLHLWLEEAVDDGWDLEATYQSESAYRHGKLRKADWVVSLNMRSTQEGAITIWAPDGLQIVPPQRYNMQSLIDGLRTCLYCGLSDVDTERVGFAGRSCKECLPEQRRNQEYAGWTR